MLLQVQSVIKTVYPFEQIWDWEQEIHNLNIENQGSV